MERTGTPLPRQERIRVVVADDSGFMRKLISDALASRGHEVVGQAADGDEALAQCERLKPDVLSLDLAMPGTQSLLERHEWIKHGTCYPGANPETYFKDALRLTAAINASPVQAFLSANIGKTVKGKDLRAKFDEGFGPGAGDRVRLACKDDGGRQLLVEVTIGIKGDITSGTPVADLIQASSPTDPGCPAGLIDPAGLQ